MELCRSDEITSLFSVYPNATKISGLFNTTCRIPLDSIIAKSTCIIEIVIPRSYPSSSITASLINPIAHAWLNKKSTLDIPANVLKQPLLNVVQAIISNFDEFATAKKAETPKSKPKTKQSVQGGETKAKKSDQQLFKNVDDLTIATCKSSPTTALEVINTLPADKIKSLASSATLESAIEHLVACKEMEPMLKLLQKHLDANEQIILQGLELANQRKQLIQEIQDLDNKLEASEALKTTSSDVKQEHNAKFHARLAKEITALETQINSKIKQLESCAEEYNFMQHKQELHSNLETLYTLGVLQVATTGKGSD